MEQAERERDRERAVVRSELGQRQLPVVRMVVRWWWACLVVGVALGQEGGLPPPTRQRPRPNNGGFSSFLSGKRGEVYSY